MMTIIEVAIMDHVLITDHQDEISMALNPIQHQEAGKAVTGVLSHLRLSKMSEARLHDQAAPALPVLILQAPDIVTGTAEVRRDTVVVHHEAAVEDMANNNISKSI